MIIQSNSDKFFKKRINLLTRKENSLTHICVNIEVFESGVNLVSTELALWNLVNYSPKRVFCHFECKLVDNSLRR